MRYKALGFFVLFLSASSASAVINTFPDPNNFTPYPLTYATDTSTDTFGNSNININYRLDSAVTYDQETNPSGSMVPYAALAHTGGSVNVKMWDYTKVVVRVDPSYVGANIYASSGVIRFKSNVKVLGIDVWSLEKNYGNVTTNIWNSKDPQTGKEILSKWASFGANIWTFVAIVPVNLFYGFNGEVGISGRVDNTWTVSTDPANQAIGSIALTGSFGPYAFLDAVASATVDAVAFAAALQGSLRLIGIQQNFSTTVKIDPKYKVTLSASLPGKLDTLSGRLDLIGYTWSIDWCRGWLGIPYPCGAHWAEVGRETLISWGSAGTLTWNKWNDSRVWQ
ncbi:MAG: hypothetical protein AABY83_14925 [Pseudomonadota bacterium]